MAKSIPRGKVRAQRTGMSNGALGLAAFLLIETAFFVSLFFGYVYLREANPHWLPAGIGVADRSIATVNVGLLLLSALTVTYGWWSIRRDQRNGLWYGLVATFILGFIFVMGQIYEFQHLSFAASDGGYGSSFYMLRTAHGAHVFVGMVFLLVVLVRAHLGQFTQRRHLAVTAGVFYWYFVALLWLPLYFMLYF